MKRELKVDIKNRFLYFILFIIIFVSGYYSGNIIGIKLLKKMITKHEGITLLIYRPANQFFNLFRLVNSNNYTERISGYYSLLDNNVIDIDFLEERFNGEKRLITKRIIIWIIGFADNFENVKNFYNSVYSDSDKKIKQEILRSLKRRDFSYFNEFVKRKKITGDFLKGL